jgi:hypothetical protein
MGKKPALIRELQAAIKRSEKTRYRIAQETGIQESALARFVNHGKGLSIANLELVCEAIGVRITLTSDQSSNTKG